MTAEEVTRRRLIARLKQQLHQPDAFRRLVDRLPAASAIHGLKVWGAMRGLYPDTPSKDDPPRRGLESVGDGGPAPATEDER